MRTGLTTIVAVVSFGLALGAMAGCYSDDRVEICDNGVDDDGDGYADCIDTSCNNSPACQVFCEDVTLVGGEKQCLGGESPDSNYNWHYKQRIELGDGWTYALWLDLYGDAIPGGITLGSHDVSMDPDTNYRTCAYCALLLRCAEFECTSFEAYYFPVAGTIELNTLDQANDGSLQGSLIGMEWVEVSIDDDTFVSEPVPGGQCFNLTAPFAFEFTVSPI